MTIPRTPRSINSILSPDVAAERLLTAARVWHRDPWNDSGTRLLTYYANCALRHGVPLADVAETSVSQIIGLVGEPEARQ